MVFAFLGQQKVDSFVIFEITGIKSSLALYVTILFFLKWSDVVVRVRLKYIYKSDKKATQLPQNVEVEKLGNDDMEPWFMLSKSSIFLNNLGYRIFFNLFS